MSGQNDNGSKVLEVIARLETLRTQRGTRSNSILSWAVSAARSLKDAFDDYLNKEILEMREIVTMLNSVNQEVADEHAQLRLLERNYQETNAKLNAVLEAANTSKIKRISFEGRRFSISSIPDPSLIRPQTEEEDLEELSIDTIINAFELIGETEELRAKIDRLSRNYTRGIQDVEGVLDALLRRRGISGTP